MHLEELIRGTMYIECNLFKALELEIMLQLPDVFNLTGFESAINALQPQNLKKLEFRPHLPTDVVPSCCSADLCLKSWGFLLWIASSL